MNKVNHEKLQNVLFRAAKEAGEVLERGFRRKKKVMRKADHSLVTDTDFKSEDVIMRHIKKNFPDHAILSEESGGEIGDEYSWLIDSLDGTGNFVKGIPFFAVCITILFSKKPIFAVVSNPILNEWYWGRAGGGAFLNKTKLRVMRTRKLEESSLIYGTGRGIENYRKWLKILKAMEGRARTLRIFGSAALGICEVAAGRFEAYLNVDPCLWDQLGGALIVEEAGGRVTDFRWKSFDLESSTLVATNKYIHKSLISRIYGTK